MATYELTSPDGEKYSVDAPDDATEQQVLSYFMQNKPAASVDTSPSAPESNDASTKAPEEDQDGWFTSGLKDAGRGVVAAGADIVNAVPDVYNAVKHADTYLKSKVGQDVQYEDTPDYVEVPDNLKPKGAVGKVVETVAPFLVPIGGWAAKAGGAGKAATAAAKVADATIQGFAGSESDGQGAGNAATNAAMNYIPGVKVANKLAKVAIDSGVNGAVAATGKGIENVIDGKDLTDDMASSAAIGGGLAGTLGLIGNKVGKGVDTAADKGKDLFDQGRVIIDQIKHPGEPIRAPRGASNKYIRKVDDVADDVDPETLDKIDVLNKLKGEDGPVELTPTQVFDPKSERGKNAAFYEREELKSADTDLSRRYADQAAKGESLAEQVGIKNRGSLTSDEKSDEVLAGIAGDLASNSKSKAQALYTDGLRAVDDQLKSTGFKGRLKAPDASKAAVNYLKPKENFGLDVQIDDAAKKDLAKVANFKARNFSDFDEMKRALNSRRSEAQRAGKYELSNMYGDLSSKLKSDADNHVARLGETVDDKIPGLWAKADSYYKEHMDDFGKGSIGNAMTKKGNATDASTVRKYLDHTNGPERIEKMYNIAQKHGDVADLQSSIASEVINKASESALGNRSPGLNYGAFGKQIGKHEEHLRKAFKDNPEVAESLLLTGKAFQLLRNSDSNRSRSVFTNQEEPFAKAGSGIAKNLYGVAGGALGGVPGYAAGKTLSKLGTWATQRSAKKKSKQLNDLALFVQNNTDAIRALKEGMLDRNPYIKQQAAQDYLELVGKKLGVEAAN